MKILFSPLLVILLSLIVPLTSAQILITEIMYDYPGPDTKFEWLELYNNDSQPINLTNYKLREGSSNHALTLIQGSTTLSPHSYVIIANDSTTFLLTYPFYNTTIFVTTFTYGLSNSGEELTIINSNNQNITSILYNTSLGANGNNNTLCVFNTYWQECIATPGIENVQYLNTSNNNYSINTTNTTFNNSYPKININIIPYPKSSLFTNQKFDQFFKIILENKDNCSIQDTLTFTYNITLTSSNILIKSSNFTKQVGCSSYSSTGEFTPLIAENYTFCAQAISSTIINETNVTDNALCYSFIVQDLTSFLCDQEITIETEENIVYNQSQSIKFQPKINNDSFPFIIEYWIEDLFGNTVKNKVNTTNTNQKSWKTDITEQDRVLYINAIVYPPCNDTNQSNNVAKKMFIVTNTIIDLTNNNASNSSILLTSNIQENQSYIKIHKISPQVPSYGDLIKVDTTIYKGSTSKYSLSVWAEQENKRISEITSFHLPTKFQEYDITLPLQIKPNCAKTYEDGSATIIIEGLDQHTEYDFNIEGLNNVLCKYYSSTDSYSSTKSSSTKNTSKINSTKTITKTSSKSKTDPSTSKTLSSIQNNPSSSQPTYIFVNSSPPAGLLTDKHPSSIGFTVYESNTSKAKNILPYLLIVTSLLIIFILLKK